MLCSTVLERPGTKSPSHCQKNCQRKLKIVKKCQKLSKIVKNCQFFLSQIVIFFTLFSGQNLTTMSQPVLWQYVKKILSWPVLSCGKILSLSCCTCWTIRELLSRLIGNPTRQQKFQAISS